MLSLLSSLLGSLFFLLVREGLVRLQFMDPLLQFLFKYSEMSLREEKKQKKIPQSSPEGIRSWWSDQASRL